MTCSKRRLSSRILFLPSKTSSSQVSAVRAVMVAYAAVRASFLMVFVTDATAFHMIVWFAHTATPLALTKNRIHGILSGCFWITMRKLRISFCRYSHNCS